MDVDTALREVDEAVAKHVGTGTYDVRRDEYERTLREAERVGDEGVVADLARWLGTYVREEEELPTVDEFDRRAASLLADGGHDVPAESHLAES